MYRAFQFVQNRFHGLTGPHDQPEWVDHGFDVTWSEWPAQQRAEELTSTLGPALALFVFNEADAACESAFRQSGVSLAFAKFNESRNEPLPKPHFLMETRL